MFCSTVIPTVARSTLAQAVESVLQQEFTADAFEVVVVNDSGKPLPEARWQRSPHVRVINTNHRERCVARNAGAAVARGKYLHFLDDDDWILPHAFERLWRLAQRANDAVWLYGAARFVSPSRELYGELNHQLDGNVFAHAVAGVWIPIQASWVRAKAFFEAGGFDPDLLATQDLDLTRRIALMGDFASTPHTVACILRGGNWGSTTDYEEAPEYVRWGRDNILAQPGAFTRLQKSADSSFWQGRIFHAYLAAALFNLRRKRLFTVASRTVFGVGALALAWRHALSAEYWRAVRTHHVARDFH